MGEIVLSFHDALIRQSDYNILSSSSIWINDSLIEFWFEYLSKRRFRDFNSSFISPSVTQFIKLYKNKDELASFIGSLNVRPSSFIFLPINNNSMRSEAGGSHWVLVVFNIQLQIFEYYDSLVSHQKEINEAHNLILKFMSTLLPGSSPLDNKCMLISKFKVMDCLKQEDGNSCGVHLMCNAEVAALKHLKNEIVTIDQDKINKYRAKIAKVIDTIKKEQEDLKESELDEDLN